MTGRMSVGGHRSTGFRPALVGGFTLLELLIVMAIVGSLLVVGGFHFYEARARNDLLNCAKHIASDIKMARRLSQGSGGRIVVEFSLDTRRSAAAEQGPSDLDGLADGNGNRNDEYYIIFEDEGAYGAYYNETHTPLILSGTDGDPLCDDDIVFKRESTLTSTRLRSARGSIVAVPKAMLFFSYQGTLLNFGSANKNLYLAKNGQVARLEVVGLTGATRIYYNKASYADCGGSTCTAGTMTAGVNPQWQPIRQTL